MSFSFKSLGSKTRDYRGKMAKVTLTNGKTDIYKIIGFTSGYDNGNGIATLNVRNNKINGIISIDETDISSLEIMESIPNDETNEALDEIKRMKDNPSEYKGYDDTDKMIEELLK